MPAARPAALTTMSHSSGARDIKLGLLRVSSSFCAPAPQTQKTVGQQKRMRLKLLSEMFEISVWSNLRVGRFGFHGSRTSHTVGATKLGSRWSLHGSSENRVTVLHCG